MTNHPNIVCLYCGCNEHCCIVFVEEVDFPSQTVLFEEVGWLKKCNNTDESKGLKNSSFCAADDFFLNNA